MEERLYRNSQCLGLTTQIDNSQALYQNGIEAFIYKLATCDTSDSIQISLF